MDTPWWNSGDAQSLVEALKGSISERKLRLFACARCRTFWPLLSDARSRNAVETAERLADQRASEDERALTMELACEAASIEEFEDPEDDETHLAAVAAAYASHSLWDDAYVAAHSTASPLVIPDPEGEALAIAQLRDIIGEQFPTSATHLLPLPPNVLLLAQAIYNEQSFGRLPELADALERSGCLNTGILAHCRNEQFHVRGCWALDLLLGKG